MKRTGEHETMTTRKFWCLALTGGLIAQFDWLASTMVGSAADAPIHDKWLSPEETRQYDKK